MRDLITIVPPMELTVNDALRLRDALRRGRREGLLVFGEPGWEIRSHRRSSGARRLLASRPTAVQVSKGMRGRKICRRPQQIHVHLNGHYAGTKDDLAATVTSAIRDAVRRGAIPKNVLTSL